MEHHAYYIEGAQTQFEEYKAALTPSYARQYERFGVDEARELISLAGLKNYQAGEAVYFLGIAAITTEAQQALLKLFEEPQGGTVFILLVPHGVLLPTVRSRMMEWEGKPEFGGQNSLVDVPARGTTRGLFEQQIPAFLKGSQKDRSDFIAKLLKEEDKEKVRDFINALEAELYKKVADPHARAALQDIALVRDYLRDRSPSLKMLLEHLALSV
jgi:DNA polymerase III delta prime subunit